MSILESTNSAKSWGDYVRAVEQERRCMVQTQPQPLFRVSCHEVSCGVVWLKVL